jgi:hypothetical protein
MPSFVQVKAASVSSALATLTFDAPVTAGNSIVVCIAKLNSAIALDALTDDQSGSYSLVIYHADSGSRQIYQYVDVGAAGGTTTVTLDLAGIETFSWAIVEMSAGPSTSSVGGTSGNGTTHQAANQSNVDDDALFLLASCANVGIDSPEVVTAGDGYTNRLQEGALYIQTKSVSALETNDGSFTTGNARRFAHALAVYGGLPDPIIGTVIIGANITVTSSGTVALNPDAETRTVHAPGSVFIGGNLAFPELATPPTAIAGLALVFAEDNGSGKTRLMVQFPTGSAQQLSIEP